MNGQDSILAYLLQLLFHLPVIIVYVIGLAFSIINYKKNSKVSIAASIAFLILLVIAFVASALPLLPVFFQRQAYSIQSIGYVLGMTGFVMTLFSAIASGLLIYGVWKDRS